MADSPTMPSQLHEALLQLFRNRPMLAPELLRDVLHVALPEFTEARIESEQTSDLRPATPYGRPAVAPRTPRP
jgi:hypothetical protein